MSEIARLGNLRADEFRRAFHPMAILKWFRFDQFGPPGVCGRNIVTDLTIAAVMPQRCSGCWQFATKQAAEMAAETVFSQVPGRVGEEISGGEDTVFADGNFWENIEK